MDSNQERPFYFCIWSPGKNGPQDDRGVFWGQRTSLNCVRERSGPNTKLSGRVWRRQVERPGELWMWAAARCNAALWGMPPLRRAPTISSSSNQWIYSRRAIREVARGTSLTLGASSPSQTRRHYLRD